MSVAAILEGLVGGGAGPVLALLSGGNIDASLMVQVMRRGLALAGRYLVVRTCVARPAGRAREAARPARGGARERGRGGAPARGGVGPGRLHGCRAHAAHPRSGALRAAPPRSSASGAIRPSASIEPALRRAARAGRGEARRACAGRPCLLRRLRVALPRTPCRPPALRPCGRRALVVVLPFDDDRPLDDDPLGSPAGRARPLRVERLRAEAEPARDPVVVLLRRRRAPRDPLRRRIHRPRPLPRRDALPAAPAYTEPRGDAGRDRALGDEQAAPPAGDRASVRRQRRRARPAVRCPRSGGACVRDDLLRRRGRADAHGRAGRARGRPR